MEDPLASGLLRPEAAGILLRAGWEMTGGDGNLAGKAEEDVIFFFCSE